MAAKKKGDAITTLADTATATPPQDEAAAGQDPTTGNKDISVEDIAAGQQQVNLLDLSISAEDIAVVMVCKPTAGWRSAPAETQRVSTQG